MQLPILSSTSMYKLTVMNMTTAAIDQTDTVFRAALILEWVLISIGFGETMLLWYLLRYTNQYHRNLAMIVEQLPNQYFPSLIARMFMIYKQLTIPKTVYCLVPILLIMKQLSVCSEISRLENQNQMISP
uniref:Serpentine receptor class gamma n=1 Tax=Caenorhabditis tropicalis TaxID=1561998 RepID=A0A1I7UXH9_9PELO